MTRLLAIPLLAFAANHLQAAEVRVCVANEAKLDRFTSGQFERELVSLFQAGGVAASVQACGHDGTARVVLRPRPEAGHPDDVLGAAKVTGGLIQRELVVFVEPVRRMLPSGLPTIVGTALARVAAHELTHLLDQSASHHRSGLMTETFTAARLMSDPRSFVPRLRQIPRP